ncbi:hypothetical protein [Algivirga pacifica]|uniref:Tsi6 domain-containing protein n=1 Tax=Algivirga pacifica TaxID=1162670 RepID=A0ABP9D6M9_9BACT
MSDLKIAVACEEALEKLSKLNKDGVHSQIVADLQWVLGSYSFDGNPEGLYEKGLLALNELKVVKKDKPRAVAKKLLDSLDVALAEK